MPYVPTTKKAMRAAYRLLNKRDYNPKRPKLRGKTAFVVEYTNRTYVSGYNSVKG